MENNTQCIFDKYKNKLERFYDDDLIRFNIFSLEQQFLETLNQNQVEMYSKLKSLSTDLHNNELLHIIDFTLKESQKTQKNTK